MKHYLIILALLSGCLITSGQELSEELADLQKDISRGIRINNINDVTVRNGKEKSLRFKFASNQDVKYKDEIYRMRLTVELTDKDTDKVYYAQHAILQGPTSDEYTGKDTWDFLLPLGDLKNAKFTAYAAEYEIIKDEKEIPVGCKLSRKIKSSKDITNATTNRLEFATFEHTFEFINSEGETVTSSPN